MIVVRFLISISILLNLILAFFSTTLLINLLQGNNNFLFSVTLSNLAETSDYFKAGTGIMVGSSIFLTILLIVLGVHYQTSFDTDLKGIQTENSKMEDYHAHKTLGGRAVETLIGIFIIFMALGSTLYSVDWFSKLYNSPISNNDQIYCWSIFGLSVTIVLLLSIMMLFFLIKKPVKKEVENYKENFCNFSINYLLNKFSNLRKLDKNEDKIDNVNWYNYIYSKLDKYQDCKREEKTKLATLLSKKYSVNNLDNFNSFLKTLENNYSFFQ